MQAGGRRYDTFGSVAHPLRSFCFLCHCILDIIFAVDEDQEVVKI